MPDIYFVTLYHFFSARMLPTISLFMRAARCVAATARFFRVAYAVAVFFFLRHADIYVAADILILCHARCDVCAARYDDMRRRLLPLCVPCADRCRATITPRALFYVQRFTLVIRGRRMPQITRMFYASHVRAENMPPRKRRVLDVYARALLRITRAAFTRRRDLLPRAPRDARAMPQAAATIADYASTAKSEATPRRYLRDDERDARCQRRADAATCFMRGALRASAALFDDVPQPLRDAPP